MEANCECQYTLMVTNEIMQGQFPETKDNFNHVPSIHEVDEEETDEEYVCDQDSTILNEVQEVTDIRDAIDNNSLYSNESFCSDESCDESEGTNTTPRTLNESHYTPQVTYYEYKKEDNEEKCESVIQDNGNTNSARCKSSLSVDKSIILKTIRSRRKNMSFTDEELRKIEWENQLLLRKIMAQQKPKEKVLHENIPQQRASSSAINRKKLQKKIESENILLLQRLQQTKSRVMNIATKPGCRQTIL
ncbi:PREDICTED: uncharacterized protein LOC107192420 [Dufourea novaeangliae]|uniref:uncharacterized protein LOC107192420 n=1 Tax=Dufourea novaeangliae TaxID=178035 RepID=UPI0007672F9A|nr:PREDICTED: uncharacterized protein LOC107192420 [Dufourea novaeangliae]